MSKTASRGQPDGRQAASQIQSAKGCWHWNESAPQEDACDRPNCLVSGWKECLTDAWRLRSSERSLFIQGTFDRVLLLSAMRLTVRLT